MGRGRTFVKPAAVRSVSTHCRRAGRRGGARWRDWPASGRRSRDAVIPRDRRVLLAACTTTVRGTAREVVLEPGEDPVPSVLHLRSPRSPISSTCRRRTRSVHGRADWPTVAPASAPPQIHARSTGLVGVSPTSTAATAPSPTPRDGNWRCSRSGHPRGVVPQPARPDAARTGRSRPRHQQRLRHRLARPGPRTRHHGPRPAGHGGAPGDGGGPRSAPRHNVLTRGLDVNAARRAQLHDRRRPLPRCASRPALRPRRTAPRSRACCDR